MPELFGRCSESDSLLLFPSVHPCIILSSRVMMSVRLGSLLVEGSDRFRKCASDSTGYYPYSQPIDGEQTRV